MYMKLVVYPRTMSTTTIFYFNKIWSTLVRPPITLRFCKIKGWTGQEAWHNYCIKSLRRKCVAESSGLARFQGACLPVDTKCPESELNQMAPSSTPDGRTRTIHILHLGSNNEYKLTILSPFRTTQSLRNSYYNTRGSECDKLTAEIK
jgi:hypothetical protein